ncbi:MAG TPA: hypothetical protein VK563_02870 [Puia sp.]|nr:hypothetical protein [Puia sp.]
MQKELLAKKDYSAVGEEISHEMAADFIKSYANAYPDEVKHFGMGKIILEKMLAQPGCVGMRFYNGINEKGEKTLVYVGIDEAGNDIVKRTMVDEEGNVAITNGLISDRNDGEWSLFGWIFGY